MRKPMLKHMRQACAQNMLKQYARTDGRTNEELLLTLRFGSYGPYRARAYTDFDELRLTMGEFAKGFRVEFPDGFHVDGAQFPSGRCVLDDPVVGLIEVATSLEELPLVKNYPLALVVWATEVAAVPDGQ